MKLRIACMLVLCCMALINHAQSHLVMPSDQIRKLLPSKLEGFRSGESKSKLISLGTLTYSMTEKSFNARNRSIRFMLFDYAQADIMYRQTTNKWSTFKEVVSDSLLSHPFEYDNCTGWETFNHVNMKSQVLIGIRNRFYLNVEASNVELESLRFLVRQLMIKSFSE